MAVALAAITLAITFTALSSLLLYLPALALAESLLRATPSARARLWIAAAVFSLITGIAGASVGLWRALHYPLLSPHAGAPRSHVCIASFFDGPDGEWRARAAAAVGTALLLVALLRFVVGAASSRRLAVALRQAGRRVEQDWGQGSVDTYLAPVERMGVACVGLWRSLIAIGPAAARSLGGPELRAAIAHERAHARRHDNLVELALDATLPLAAFSPASWLFQTYWRREAEAACDAAAARTAGADSVTAALLAQLDARPGLGSVSRRASAISSRLAALEAVQPASSETGGLGLIVLFGSLLVVALGITVAATFPQLLDSLQCAGASLMQSLLGS